jgi:hypothetical protein
MSKKNNIIKISKHTVWQSSALSILHFNVFFNDICYQPEITPFLNLIKQKAKMEREQTGLAQNQDIVSECSNMSTGGLLLQWANTIKIQQSVLV